MLESHLAKVLEILQNEPLKVATGVGAVAGLYWAWWKFPRSLHKSWPNPRVSPHDEIFIEKQQQAARKRHAYRSFPPPYPNGWVFLCPSKTVARGKAIPVDVCGKRLVAFRGDKSGVMGVLDAYCSHMGTHLGYGSCVVDDRIECPYHQWQFNKDGMLGSMPYGGQHDCGREGNNIRSYPVVEKEGMVWAWIHADHAKPDPPSFLHIVQEKDMRFITRIIDDDYLMHPMEPSHNSTDWYHFSTVHSSLGTHWKSKWKWMDIQQTILPTRSAVHGSRDDDGSEITRKDMLIIDEKIKGVKLLGFQLPTEYAANYSESQVRIYGPRAISFSIKFRGLGEMNVLMPLTPVAPFVTHVEYWVSAQKGVPWLLAYLMGHLLKITVSQDREVWEHRAHKWPRNQVKGDYSFGKYDKWLQYFYSESSMKWEDLDMSW
jgi:nitrite reductase/ring-hydroxylating ferredoxin subunit